VNLLNDLWEFNVAKGEWAWISGAESLSCPNNPMAVCTPRATYGTKGIGSSGNTPGGREEAVTWVDAHGNLWMFGGTGVDTNGIIGGQLNELWEFKPAEKTWTWIGGENTVGPRSGQPGVYGQRGVPSDRNYPGARFGSVGWTDPSGNLWLFAGDGHDSLNESGDLDDLWKYNPTTNLWTWIGGSDLVGIDGLLPGVYGTLGVPSAANAPGGRYPGLVWVDKQGNAWLFGGYGADALNSASPSGYLNDLWEFNNATQEWTWMAGSSQVVILDANLDSGVPGAYGTLGSPAAGNAPGGRDETVGWTDSQGNLWLFGGTGVDAAGSIGSLNDVWKFEPTPPATPTAQR
jgi:N-acetylneuraminic acid mutarotase